MTMSNRAWTPITLVAGLFLAACGGDSNGDLEAAADALVEAADAGTDAGADADSSVEADADSIADADIDTDADASCPAGALGARLGRDRLLIGGSMRDEDFAAVPFDIRYQYVAGDVPDDGPCASCASGCTARGESCANTAGCSWWGCWQWDALPPGRFVRNFIDGAIAAGAIPMITTYIWFSVAGDVEGGPEIAALQDGPQVRKLVVDFRFLCRVMAEDPSVTALLHLEPDLWGYGHQGNADPTRIPVALSAAGASECAGLEDHFAGFARCLVAIVRATAPNVLVGFHASAWGAGHDALTVTDPGVDLDAHADSTAAYLRALGAEGTDFVVVEMSDRDAGFNGRWWDAANATRPHFHQAIGWVRRLGESLGLAPLWWQVPYGRPGLPNVCDGYEDNRVDYVFDHPDEFAAAGSLGVAFGAGAGCMTTPATDGGHFLTRAGAWFTSERPFLCGR